MPASFLELPWFCSYWDPNGLIFFVFYNSSVKIQMTYMDGEHGFMPSGLVLSQYIHIKLWTVPMCMQFDCVYSPSIWTRILGKPACRHVQTVCWMQWVWVTRTVAKIPPAPANTWSENGWHSDLLSAHTREHRHDFSGLHPFVVTSPSCIPQYTQASLFRGGLGSAIGEENIWNQLSTTLCEQFYNAVQWHTISCSLLKLQPCFLCEAVHLGLFYAICFHLDNLRI